MHFNEEDICLDTPHRPHPADDQLRVNEKDCILPMV